MFLAPIQKILTLKGKNITTVILCDFLLLGASANVKQQVPKLPEELFSTLNSTDIKMKQAIETNTDYSRKTPSTDAQFT